MSTKNGIEEQNVPTLSSSSQSNGARYQIPLISNLATIDYFRHAGAMLDLPVRTTATAIVFYNRFQIFMASHIGRASPRNGHFVNESMPLYTNEKLLATTCMLLACKTTDVPRKVRDVVNVSYRYYHPDGPLLKVDETYFRMRSSLVTGELFLVRALGYDLEVSLPFTYCLHVLRAMAAVNWLKAPSEEQPPRYRSRQNSSGSGSGTANIQKDVWRRMEQEMVPGLSTIARIAWMYCWDSIASPKIYHKHSTAALALGCLYLAIKTCQVDLPMPMHEWVDMWGASDNISLQSVRDVVGDLLDLYNRVTPPSSSSQSQLKQQ